MSPTGRSVGLFTVVAYLAGWRLGWIEFLIPAAAGLTALITGLPSILFRPRLEVVRELQASRVTVGDEATAVLAVTNRGSRRTGPASRVEDRIDGTVIDLGVAGLGQGETRSIERRLPTERRGVIEIGPAQAMKADALGLFRRQLTQAPIEQCWVHPRHVALAGVPAGLAHDFEGPTSDTSPAGDVSFHALREYRFGDDHRHVHWMSTARTGRLMIRHYVDNRLPQIHLVLDLDAERYVDGGKPTRSEAFETAVEVTASIGVSTITAGLPLTVQLGQTKVDPMELLDQLSIVAAGPVPMTVQAPTDASVVIIITSSDATPFELPTGMSQIVVRVGNDDRRPPFPGATTLDVSSLTDFRHAWDRVMTAGAQ